MRKTVPRSKEELEKLRKIVQIKKADLNATNEAAAMRMIEGTARNMGIEVVD